MLCNAHSAASAVWIVEVRALLLRWDVRGQGLARALFHALLASIVPAARRRRKNIVVRLWNARCALCSAAGLWQHLFRSAKTVSHIRQLAEQPCDGAGCSVRYVANRVHNLKGHLREPLPELHVIFNPTAKGTRWGSGSGS